MRQNSCKAERFHLHVANAIFLASVQELKLVFVSIVAEHTVHSALVLIKVVGTHSLPTYNVHFNFVPVLLAQFNQLFDQTLVTFGAANNFFA